MQTENQRSEFGNVVATLTEQIRNGDHTYSAQPVLFGLFERQLVKIEKLQAALREVVTDMESWTQSEYSGTDELEPRLAKLQAYHRLFED